MVELQPVEYEALVQALGGGHSGEEWVDFMAGQCDDAGMFWRYLGGWLDEHPDKRAQLAERIPHRVTCHAAAGHRQR